MKIEINTSADDLLSSFKCSIEQYTVENFLLAIFDELNGQHRKTVIKLLRRAIIAKEAGKIKL